MPYYWQTLNLGKINIIKTQYRENFASDAG